MQSTAKRETVIQKDGRCWVHEVHKEGNEIIQEFHYLADPGLDIDAVAQERAISVLEEVKKKADQTALEEANAQVVEDKIGTLGQKLLDAAMAEFSKIDPESWSKDPRGSVARLLATGLVEGAKEEALDAIVTP